MNARQRARRDAQSDLPGPAAAGAWSRPPSNPAGPGSTTDLSGPTSGAGPESATELLVSEHEIEQIRWAGLVTAMADADTHLDRSLTVALTELEKATGGAYLEYGQNAPGRLDKVIRGALRDYHQAVSHAFATRAAARRAAMNAHELAQTGQLA